MKAGSYLVLTYKRNCSKLSMQCRGSFARQGMAVVQNLPVSGPRRLHISRKMQWIKVSRQRGAGSLFREHSKHFIVKFILEAFQEKA